LTKSGAKSKISVKLDIEQGFVKPKIDESLLCGKSNAEDDGNEGNFMPVSFTSRHGKWNESMEIIKEKKYLEDKQCWCSICNSMLHTHKVTYYYVYTFFLFSFFLNQNIEN
jgi:hypothetical protein